MLTIVLKDGSKWKVGKMVQTSDLSLVFLGRDKTVKLIPILKVDRIEED